ncbi:MAG: protein kinase [Actinomycetota bacterium]|nr:protein kinase [Actinomycetota bacterium]
MRSSRRAPSNHHRRRDPRGRRIGTDTSRRVAGRYELRERLGRGGSGTVWRGHDTVLNRDVAIKQIDVPGWLSDDERREVRQRSLREARTAARLHHRSATTVYDVAEEDGAPFIIMEYVDARTLSDIVEEEGALDEARAAAIGLDLIAALSAAHHQGILHRDVKPSNVMVPDQGPAVLTDFGIATFADDPRLTRAGTVMGSPAFMAPEQARDEQLGPATDLWGVGATLYFAVEGEPPFGDAGIAATLHAVVADPPRPFRRADRLAPLIRSLLEKSPADRPLFDEVRDMLSAVRDATEPGLEEARARGAGAVAAMAVMDGAPRRHATQELEPVGGGDRAEAPGEPELQEQTSGVEAPVEPGSPEKPPAVEAPVAPASREKPPAVEAPAEPEPLTPVSAAEAPPEPGPQEQLPPPAAEALVEPVPQGMPPAAAVPARAGPDAQIATVTRSDSAPSKAPMVLVAVLAILLVLATAWLARNVGTPGDDVAVEDQVVPDQIPVEPPADDRGAEPQQQTDRRGSNEGPRREEDQAQDQAATGRDEDGTGALPAGWVRFKPEGEPYAIAHPAGWRLRRHGDNRTDIVDPQTGDYIRLDWTPQAKDDPYEDRRVYSRQFASTKGDYEEIRLERTTFRGHPAAIWEFVYTDRGARLHAAQLNLRTGRYGHSMLFQTTANRWGERGQLFRQLQEYYEPE